MKKHILIMAIVLFLSIPAHAETITLAWDASVSEVDGYVLQYWEAATPETVFYEPVDSLTLTATVNIGVGEWHFNAIAYMLGVTVPSNESNEVVYKITGYLPPEKTSPSPEVNVAPGEPGNLRKL